MGKETRVEIHAQIPCFSPVNPALKLGRGVGVTLDLFPVEIGIAGVQIKPVASRDQRQRTIQIAAKFSDRPRLAGIIARGLDTAAGKLRADCFKASHVVALPAVQSDRNCSQGGQCAFSIDAEFGIVLAGGFV